MIQVSLRTEYSFNVFAPIDRIQNVIENPDEPKAIGIADQNSTFGHYRHYTLCKKNDVNPILGVRLMVTEPKEWAENRNEGKRTKMWGPFYAFIAKDYEGLTEMYRLVKLAYENFYYHPFIEINDLVEVSDRIIVIAESFQFTDRIDYIGIGPRTDVKLLGTNQLPRVAVSDNKYINSSDRDTYQLFAGDKSEDQTYPQYILSESEHFALYKDRQAINNTYNIANQCDVEFKRSDMVRYNGTDNIQTLCLFGAKRKGIDLSDEVYKERFEYELGLIEKKEYADYFLIVADMIKFAKKSMLVGPSRGSSAGSLVCYLLDITEVDPIEHGLIFERFIDINRDDLPDIDVDFPDVKRDSVVKYLSKKYGDEKVSHIATISRLKPKSAIGIFAKNLSVPFSMSEEVKGAIIERSGGDARAAMCIQDTFESTEIGRDFISAFPKMKMVEKIENHASHTGTHAAGIIVCNDDLTSYGGVNVRENVVMLDKKEAESLNLLKIDCLGLRTLSILQEVADRIGMEYSDYSKLPLDDDRVFNIFNDMRLFGVFQFEGYALQSVTRQMGVNSFNDISAITALARPGPIHSGGTNLYIKRRTGQEKVEYLSDHQSVIDSTSETYGIIIYQEQLMEISRNYGNMSWEDVSAIRKASSKSLGEEFFNQYKDKFMEGSSQHGASEREANKVWENMMTFGSWGFNKSHAVSYGMVSYWTAWAKAYHPVEFAAANMNNTRSEQSAIRILREMVKNDGIEYDAIDPDDSTDRWEISELNGSKKLVGSLTNIKGIGDVKARSIVNNRKKGKLTRQQIKVLMDAETPYDILFPAEHYWGDLYSSPAQFGLDKEIDLIENVREKGNYLIIGRLVDRNLRDLNEYQSVVKRGGKIIETDTLFLNMTVEDDTDSIICSIDRFKFEELGRTIAEHGKVNQDWYLISGRIDSDWRRLSINNIMNLWEWRKSD